MAPQPQLDVAVVLPDDSTQASWPGDLLAAHLEAAGHRVRLARDASGTVDADVVHCLALSAAEGVVAADPDAPLLITPALDEDVSTAPEVLASASAVVRSSHEKEQVHRLGIPWSRTWVLPGAVDADTFSRMGPMANRTDRFRLVSEMSGPDDGLEDVIAAISSRDDIELVVLRTAGRGPEAETDLAARETVVRDAAAEKGVAGRLAVVDAASDGERAWWLRSAHVAVAVPHVPAGGDFAVQAMACGKAVVVAPLDGLPDLVVHGVTGMHVPASDPLSLAGAVGSLLESDFAVESQGIAAADRALSRFAWPRVVQELVSVYRRVADERAGAVAPDHDLDPDADPVPEAEEPAPAAG